MIKMDTERMKRSYPLDRIGQILYDYSIESGNVRISLDFGTMGTQVKREEEVSMVIVNESACQMQLSSSFSFVIA